jgi:hypothetical protein
MNDYSNYVNDEIPNYTVNKEFKPVQTLCEGHFTSWEDKVIVVILLLLR